VKEGNKSELSKGEYKGWIRNLKVKFQQSQIKAAVRVNSTLLEFYWELGSDIVEKQKNAKWGSGFLKQATICKNKDKTVVEYALSDINKPIGVTEYQLTKSLPEKFKSSLPSIEEIEIELNDIKER